MAKSQRQRLEDLEKKVRAKIAFVELTKAQAWGMARHVYQSKWIREQYGIDDPVSEATDEWWALHRFENWDEASFDQFLMEKIAREPARFQRIYGDLFRPATVNCQPPSDSQ